MWPKLLHLSCLECKRSIQTQKTWLKWLYLLCLSRGEIKGKQNSPNTKNMAEIPNPENEQLCLFSGLRGQWWPEKDWNPKNEPSCLFSGLWQQIDDGQNPENEQSCLFLGLGGQRQPEKDQNPEMGLYARFWGCSGR